MVRFESSTHVYSDEQGPVPSITQMLARAGYVNDWFMTEEGSERGRAVHALTVDLDLGAVDVASLISPYRGWVLAYASAMTMIPHQWEGIEVPRIHPVFRFGGRADRDGTVYRAEAMLEIKTGQVLPYHGVQLGLQDILKGGMPPGVRRRYGLALRENGRFKLHEFTDRRDYDRAFEVIHAFCDVPVSEVRQDVLGSVMSNNRISESREVLLGEVSLQRTESTRVPGLSGVYPEHGVDNQRPQEARSSRDRGTRGRKGAVVSGSRSPRQR